MALNDLNQMFSIVDPNTGKPTDYLMRLLRDRGIDADNIEEVVANNKELLTILQASVDAINGTVFNAGTGLAGGGTLGSDDPIEHSLDASLNNLTDVDTVTTPPTDGQALVYVAADSEWVPGDVSSGGGGGGTSVFAVFEDQKASGTDGGTASSGSWNTRTLNTSVVNNITGASLASNEFTLPAGTYRITAAQQLVRTARTSTRLYNVTDASVQSVGVNVFGLSSGSGFTASIDCVFTIAAPKTFRLEYRAGSSTTGFGLGTAASAGTEVYSRVIVEKF